MKSRSVAAAAAGIVLLGAASAQAHGRFPGSNQILFSPGDPNLIVVRTTYAVVLSNDNGQTWRYLCDDAVGIPTPPNQDPTLALTQSNTFVAGNSGTYPGLNVSTDVGCNWACVSSFEKQSIYDVFAPETPGVVFALTSMAVSGDASATSVRSQLIQSTDDGAHWAPFGRPVDGLWLRSMAVSRSNPNRIYAAGVRGFAAKQGASLVLTDDGMTWTECPISSFDPAAESGIEIAGVDPTDENRVYLRTIAIAPTGRSRLLMTANAGQSFAVLKSYDIVDAGGTYPTGQSHGFALSEDGSKLYVGSREEGIYFAHRDDLVFSKVSSVHAQCLAARGAELWACSDAVSGFVVGVSTDDGKTFAPKLPEISSLCGPVACTPNPGGPLACGASFGGSGCTDSYNLFCELDDPSQSCGQCGPDAATTPTDAGRSDARDGGTIAKSSSGCSLAGRTESGSNLPSLGVVTLLAIRRSRRIRVG